ncbi:MAG: 30S ribosomal protein S7 [Desulfomicrobium sp.]|jgi:small subunit ribosomal protein S7|nr:30S ribosomal protein S7 [Desulfomicrobium sp.]NLV97372.1 30S ribosomal protein S7 [Desulfovibrionales bacterium]
MSRKGPAPKREVLPDPKYGSRVATKFVNQMMIDGKKSISEKIFYNAIEELGKRTDLEPIKAFEQVIEKVKPLMEVKSRRVGGATYQVPMEVRSVRQEALAIRWLITYARSRGEKGMVSRLAAEFLDAFHDRGGAIKKREDTHRMAEANKAFAHYRW